MIRAPLSAVFFTFTATAAMAQSQLPTDFTDSCGVSTELFDSWFKDGKAATGGAVMAADGFSFPPVNNTACDFYQWGAQMFLWITSPAATANVTFDTTEFFDVVETGSGFEFQSNAGSEPNPMLVRTIKEQDIGGTGQAGGGDVLLSQQGSLVYYGIHTNDIYAGYLTGQKAGAFSGDSIARNFPISQADVQMVETYTGRTFENPQAMTMELKTAWVDASTVNASDFITLDAIVPTFDRSGSETSWPLTGTEPLTLALVGVHIVAPVAGHPELVWSSFEHVSVSPMLDFYYLDSAGNPTLQPFDGAGDWVFFPDGGSRPTSQPLVPSTAAMDSKSGAIVADAGMTIAPVAVVQENPWGLSPDEAANAKANTDLVSLNASVSNMMMGVLGDVRGNYIQIGGIWTVTGELPTGGTDTNIRGGNRLANATMETFHQYPDQNNGFQSENCFTCHNVSAGATDGIGLSHIFGGLAPLPN